MTFDLTYSVPWFFFSLKKKKIVQYIGNTRTQSSKSSIAPKYANEYGLQDCTSGRIAQFPSWRITPWPKSQMFGRCSKAFPWFFFGYICLFWGTGEVEICCWVFRPSWGNDGWYGCWKKNKLHSNAFQTIKSTINHYKCLSFTFFFIGEDSSTFKNPFLIKLDCLIHFIKATTIELLNKTLWHSVAQLPLFYTMKSCKFKASNIHFRVLWLNWISKKWRNVGCSSKKTNIDTPWLQALFFSSWVVFFNSMDISPAYG